MLRLLKHGLILEERKNGKERVTLREHSSLTVWYCFFSDRLEVSFSGIPRSNIFRPDYRIIQHLNLIGDIHGALLEIWCSYFQE